MRSIVATIVCTLTIVTTGCATGDDRPEQPDFVARGLPTSAALGSAPSPGTPLALCGPFHLQRGPGPSQIETLECNLEGTFGELTLVGFNGGLDDGSRVTSGSVRVNGTEVLSANNFGNGHVQSSGV